MAIVQSEDLGVRWLREHGRKLTVSNWLALNYWNVPDDLQDQPELLEEVPWDELENDTNLQQPMEL